MKTITIEVSSVQTIQFTYLGRTETVDHDKRYMWKSEEFFVEHNPNLNIWFVDDRVTGISGEGATISDAAKNLEENTAKLSVEEVE